MATDYRQPPSDLKLDKADVRKRPPPSPPTLLRHQIFSDSRIFSKLDAHAVQVAKRPHRDLRDLLYDLVLRHNLQELEKARVLYRWLTVVDLERLEFAGAAPDGPEQVLLLFKKRKTTYARIFETLCLYSGVHCVTVIGYAKGVDFRVGHRFAAGKGSAAPLTHSWNAVHVPGAGGWQLVDVHWGARYMPCADKVVADAYTGTPVAEDSDAGGDKSASGLKSPGSRAMIYELDDYYFLMEPHQAVLSHFPREPDADWQLLAPEQRASLANFEGWPLVKSQFFKCGMDLLNETAGTVQAKEGRVALGLGFWLPNALFTYKLQYLKASGASTPSGTSGGRLEENVSGLELRRYVLQEVQLPLGHVSFFLRLPLAGTYFLTVYAALLDTSKQGVAPSEQIYRAAAEYRIVADVAHADARPFPSCHDLLWGVPLTSPLCYGLYTSSVLEGAPNAVDVSGDPARLVADASGTVRLRLVRVNALGDQARVIPKLVLRRLTPGADEAAANSVEFSDSELDRSISVEDKGDQVIYSLRLPTPGEYGLEMYANQPLRDEDTYWHICQYLISYPGAEGGPRDDNQADPGLVLLAKEFGLVSPLTSKRTVSLYAADHFLRGYYSTVEGFTILNPTGPWGQNLGPNGLPLQENLQNQQVTPLYTPSSLWVPDDLHDGRDDVATRLGVRDHSARRGDKTKSTLDEYQPEMSTANWNVASEQINKVAPEAFVAERVGAETAPMVDAIAELSIDDLSADIASDPEGDALMDLADDTSASRPADLYRAFARVDTHAIECAKLEYRSFRDLIWALIYARNICDDLEKARAIFLWLCTKDLSKVVFDQTPAPGSPEEMLLGIRSGRSTYAQVFELLCSYAGLHCVIVTGRAKGADYEPGMKFVGKQGAHTWNAIFIHGNWCLVDCHWAARRLTGKHAVLENVRYELDMFYFLPSPAHLAYSHHPDSDQWELLRRPLSIAEFEALPPAKSTFFKLGLQFLSHRRALIEWPTPTARNRAELVVRIGFPAWRTGLIAFIATLAGEDGQEEYKGEKLSRWCYEEIVGHSTLVHVRFPEAGTYKLVVYAKEVEADSTTSSLPARESVYGAVCEYKVVATAASVVSFSAGVPAFPPCQNMHYGPLEAARRYRLQPDRRENKILAEAGYFELKFAISRPMRFMSKLKYYRGAGSSPAVDDAALERALITRTVRDSEGKVNGFLPAAGEYGLEVYANDPAADGNTLYQVWQLLVVTDAASPSARALPQLPGSFLGPQARFASSGLQPLSHVDPYVRLAVDNRATSFVFGTRLALRMTVQLIFAGPGPNEDLSSFVLQQSRVKENQIEFAVRLPRVGFYKLQIFALPSNETAESLPNVFNYLIELASDGSEQLAPLQPFPKQFAQWKDSCYLHEPQSGVIHASDLRGNGQLPMRLFIPKAQAVSAVCGEEWFALNNAGDGMWSTELELAPLFQALAAQKKIGKLSVCANFGAAKASFSTLLEYAMQP